MAVTYIQKSQYCVTACSAALHGISFPGHHASAGASPTIPCTSPLYIESLYYCAAAHCTEHQAESGLARINSMCGMALPSYAAFKANHSTASIAAIKRISHQQAMSSSSVAVIPDQDLYDLGYESTASMNYTNYLNWNFAWALYGFWGLVIVVGMVNRIVQAARHRSDPQANLIKGDVMERQYGSIIGRAGRWTRRNLLMPLAFGNKRQKPLNWCAPTRIEGLLVGLYVVINIVFCFPGYHIVEGNL